MDDRGDPLRVLHVIASLDPSMGGLPKAALCLAAAQAAAGVETALLHYGCDADEPDLLSAYGTLPGFASLRRIRIVPTERGEWLWGSRAKQAMDAFSPGVIHTHGLWEPLLRHAHDHARARSVPYVFCPHAMLHPWHMKRKRLAKFLLMVPLGWRKRWREAAFVHALSREEETYLRRAGFTDLRCVPNGIFPDEDLYAFEPDLPGIDGHPFVLFLARLHEQKAPDILLEAFAELAEEHPELRLVLAGPDYGLADALEERVRTRGLDGRVLIPGALSVKEKWSALHQCACFCLPSHAEGFSMALLEAALAGAAIVMSPGCHFPELAEAGAARMCLPEVAALSAELRAVLEDPHAAARMGNRARRLVCEHYTWDHAARALLEQYRSVGA